MSRIKRRRFEFKPQHYLSSALRKICAEHDPPISVRDLSVLLDKPTETFRRILSDGRTTSDNLIEDIAEALELSDEEANRLMDLNLLDRFEADYGGYINVSGTDMPLVLFQRWATLSDSQKKLVSDMISGLSRENLNKDHYAPGVVVVPELATKKAVQKAR